MSTSAVFEEETLELVLADSEREAFSRLRTSSVLDDDPLGVSHAA